MAVNLKTLPALAVRPHPPVWWGWLLLLAGMLLLGMADAILSNTTKAQVNAEAFWMTALKLPSLLWLVLLTLRMAWYKGRLATANAKDEDRNRMLRRETLRGQRSLHVFGASLHTALREPNDTDGQQHWDALLAKTQALRTQPSWKSDEGVRHSRLIRKEGENAEQLLTRGIRKTLEELSQLLSLLPDETPLALLLESDSSLPEKQIATLWQACLEASHIRQPMTPIEGTGLGAVDAWLDHRRHEHTLLLVIALQVVPDSLDNSAESVVGLLLGNSQIAYSLTPIARLHRPEQMHHTDITDLHYALRQSLEWVPTTADTVKNGWLVGVTPSWQEGLATGLQAIQSPINIGQDLCDFGQTLGYPGPAAPWVTLACASAGAERGDVQLIVSGDNHENTPLWVTLVTPATTPGAEPA